MTAIIPGNEERGYNPNQPREPNGRFASTGGGAGGGNINQSSIVVDKLRENAIINERDSKPVTVITDTSINRVPNIKSNEYSSEQCAEIQQQHKELLKYSRDNNEGKEVAFVFDGNLKNRKEFKGEDDRLEIGSAIYGKDLIVMHNHPRNSSFSDADMKFFLKNDTVKTLTIVKNDGRVEMITKKESYDAGKAKIKIGRLFKDYVKTESDSEIDKAIRKFLSKEDGIEWVI